MFNLFKLPIEKGSLEAWSKLSDDVAKVAILAVPVILYGEKTPAFKGLNIGILIVIIYFFLTIGRVLRQFSEEK